MTLSVTVRDRHRSRIEVLAQRTVLVAAGTPRTITVGLGRPGEQRLNAWRTLRVRLKITQGSRVDFARSYELRLEAVNRGPGRPRSASQ